MYIKHSLVAVKGLKQVVIKLTVQHMVNFMFKKKKKKGVDVQLFRITHMATEISKTLYNKMISLWSW